MEDRLIVCQDMNVYIDRTVSLVRPKGDAAEAPTTAEPEPQAEITLVECIHNVVAISRKVDPVRRITMQQQRIEGDYLTYDKLTGDFHVPGAGMVYIWSRGGQEPTGPALGASEAARRGVVRVSDPAASRRVAGRPRRRRPRRRPGPDRPAPGRDQGGRQARPAADADPGQLPQGDAGPVPRRQGDDKAETRWADFFGDVQTLRARVDGLDATFDFDHPPAGSTYLTAQTMRLVSEPIPATSGPAPARRGTSSRRGRTPRRWPATRSSRAT